MTREELLKFVQTTGIVNNLSVIKRQQILLAIKELPEDKLPELKKELENLYEKQKPLLEEVTNLAKQVQTLKQKAKSFLNRASEQKEDVVEEEKTETLLKQI